MFHKVENVVPLPEYALLIRFENGEQKRYDVNPLFHKWDAFQALTLTQGLFEQVAVDAGGYGIRWSDDIDLSCDELYYNGAPLN